MEVLNEIFTIILYYSCFIVVVVAFFFRALEYYNKWKQTPCLQIFGENEKDINEFMWRFIYNRRDQADKPYPYNYEVVSWKGVTFAVCTNGSKLDGAIILTRKAFPKELLNKDEIYMHPEYDRERDMERLAKFIVSLK